MSLDLITPPGGGDDLPIALFERYCAGDATPPERAEIEAWMRRHPERQAWYEQLREGLAAGRFGEMSEADIGRHTDAILRRIRNNGVPQRVAMPPHGLGRGFGRGRSLVWPLWSLLGVAAVALVWLGMTTLRPAAHPGSMLTYTTGNGERAKITLPDGSTASLNVASRLDVPADYLSGNHTVHLRGEALFTVSHQAGRSFAVVTDSTTVHVLGTSFVVRHYADDTATVIAVREGKVGVRSAVLTAAQEIAVGPAGRVRPIQPADPARFSFANGVLTLTGGLLVDAIPELDRWYDADIRVQDPALATRRLTGEYAAGSLADLASILEMTFGVRVVRQGRVLTLYPR